MNKLTPETAKYTMIDNLLDECLTSSRKSNTVNVQDIIDFELSDAFKEWSDTNVSRKCRN